MTFSREELPGMVRAPNLCLPLSSCLSDGGIFFHDDGDFFFHLDGETSVVGNVSSKAK